MNVIEFILKRIVKETEIRKDGARWKCFKLAFYESCPHNMKRKIKNETKNDKKLKQENTIFANKKNNNEKRQQPLRTKSRIHQSYHSLPEHSQYSFPTDLFFYYFFYAKTFFFHPSKISI